MSPGRAAGNTTQLGPGAARARRPPLSTHTQERRSRTRATTEFWSFVTLVVAILISAALIEGGDNGTDEFIARQAWLYVSILGAGYFVSRGLAKSGSREF